jgi:hypothetical protein
MRRSPRFVVTGADLDRRIEKVASMLKGMGIAIA